MKLHTRFEPRPLHAHVLDPLLLAPVDAAPRAAAEVKRLPPRAEPAVSCMPPVTLVGSRDDVDADEIARQNDFA